MTEYDYDEANMREAIAEAAKATAEGKMPL
jgi:hypothetical protein